MPVLPDGRHYHRHGVHPGFGEAARQTADLPERLKDITFPASDSHTFSQHGFLVFYSMEDIAKKVAYSNHSTAYLIHMYVLYKVEMHVHSLAMRVTSAIVSIVSLAGVTFPN